MKNSLSGMVGSGPTIVGILLTGAPVVFSSLLTYYTAVYEPAIRLFGYWQWLLLIGVCSMTSVLALTPPTFLALVFGYFLGWKALLPLFGLNIAAILLVNQLIRWVDQDRFRRQLERNPKVRAIVVRMHRQELKVIFFAKLSPVLPFAVTNLLFALSGAKLKNILLGGFLGMIPRTVLAIWTGKQAHEIRVLLENPNQGSWSQAALGLLVLISIGGLFFVLKHSSES